MSKKLKILFILGTRPEAIKLSPLIKTFIGSGLNVKICSTGQHKTMLDQVLNFFEIKPDVELSLMKENQTLFDITSIGLKLLENVVTEFSPDWIIVQGDTTTAFIGALAGYYKKIKVAHIEAGLRSGDLYSPFPEEGNRKLVGHLSTLHFAPTTASTRNLLKEGIKDNVHIVGNTVIDALFLGLNLLEKESEDQFIDKFKFLKKAKKIILVTGHRRESFGEPFENICKAIKLLSQKYNDVQIVYPVHLNPNVQKPVNTILNDLKNVHLIAPLSYPHMLWMMSRSYIILTDSGGIQEEAPSLGKPVLVMRDKTERIEGIESGTAKLVGSDMEKIVKEVSLLLESKPTYEAMSKAINPYGDGKTSGRILEILTNY